MVRSSPCNFEGGRSSGLSGGCVNGGCVNGSCVSGGCIGGGYVIDDCVVDGRVVSMGLQRLLDVNNSSIYLP